MDHFIDKLQLKIQDIAASFEFNLKDRRGESYHLNLLLPLQKDNDKGEMIGVMTAHLKSAIANFFADGQTFSKLPQSIIVIPGRETYFKKVEKKRTTVEIRKIFGTCSIPNFLDLSKFCSKLSSIFIQLYNIEYSVFSMPNLNE